MWTTLLLSQQIRQLRVLILKLMLCKVLQLGLVEGESPDNQLLCVIIVCICAHLIGKKSDDPQSPSYVPSIFGANDSRKYEQQQRRYEALEHRRQIKEQAESAGALNTGEEQTEEQEMSVPAGEFKALQEEYKSLQEDYRLRVEE